MKVHDLPAHQRPREKLFQLGADNLSNKELLAILLRTGRAGKSVLEIAQDILKKFPEETLLSITNEDLKQIKGLDTAKTATLLAAFELTRRLTNTHQTGRPIVETTKEALAQLHDIRNLKKEHFVALYLNARNELIHREQISVGTVNASLVHPRDVFAPAIEHNATAIIVAHNHPSGNPEPSAADSEITKNLREAGELLGITIVRSLILTEHNYQEIT